MLEALSSSTAISFYDEVFWILAFYSDNQSHQERVSEFSMAELYLMFFDPT